MFYTNSVYIVRHNALDISFMSQEVLVRFILAVTKYLTEYFLGGFIFLKLILKSIVTGSVHRTQCLALTHHLMFP